MKTEAQKIKVRIQALLRDIVIARDKGCILRQVMRCGGEVGECVLQADHLITRANSATYGDTRLVVCVCKNCHGWKHWHKEDYDILVKTLLSKERVALWDLKQLDSHRPQKMDWKLVEIALKEELKSLTE